MRARPRARVRERVICGLVEVLVPLGGVAELFWEMRLRFMILLFFGLFLRSIGWVFGVAAKALAMIQ